MSQDLGIPTVDKQWFVLHTLSGQENKVKANIERRKEVEEMDPYIEDILVPSEKVSEVKDGKKKEVTRKFFPGYVLAHIALYDASRNLNEKTWHFIKETPGIIGFVGGDRPVPLRVSEVDQLMNQIEEKQDRVAPKIEFEIGETVKINDGPFESMNGDIEEIDPDRGRLKVSVSIFGRSTSVELEYWQVEKVV